MYYGAAKKGFTLIEIILVIAILGILFASSAPALTQLLITNNMEVAEDKVLGNLRKAQNYAMNGRNDTAWGVCKFNTKIRLFRDSCLTPSYFEDYDLTGVTMSDFPEVIFSGQKGQRGEPSATPTITLQNDLGSTTININSAGGIEVN